MQFLRKREADRKPWTLSFPDKGPAGRGAPLPSPSRYLPSFFLLKGESLSSGIYR